MLQTVDGISSEEFPFLHGTFLWSVNFYNNHLLLL